MVSLAQHARQFYWTITLANPRRRWRDQRPKRPWRKLGDDASRVIRDWARGDIAPWTGLVPDAALAAFERLNATAPTIFIYDIEPGRASRREKPSGLPAADPGWESRKDGYLDLLQEASERLSLRTTLALDIADLPADYGDVPVFAFQRRRGGRSPLLPDPDFWIWQWYYDHIDRWPRWAKRYAAIFVGSSTGDIVLTAEAVAADTPNRLSLAAEALAEPLVTFAVCSAVQCDNAATVAALKRKPYFRPRKIGYFQQYRHRFIVSVDGNGPTCSRVALTLMSNSVLLKQDSPHELYWYKGLTVGVHYLPFQRIADAAVTIAAYSDRESALREISEAANHYALTYLSKPAVLAYLDEILTQYARLFTTASPCRPGAACASGARAAAGTSHTASG